MRNERRNAARSTLDGGPLSGSQERRLAMGHKGSGRRAGYSGSPVDGPFPRPLIDPGDRSSLAALPPQKHLMAKDPVSELIGGGVRTRTPFTSLLNRFLYKFKLPWKVVKNEELPHVMCSVEQRINFSHLVDQVLAYGVVGDLVELGCYEGQTAALIQMVNVRHQARPFHVYDAFVADWNTRSGTVQERLKRRFAAAGLPGPIMHEGDMRHTLPAELPERIAFAHFDCGMGDDPERHRDLLLHCLEHVYPRLSPGAIAVFMDYHDPDRTVNGLNSNPGVRMACDGFLADRPERMEVLYGNDFSHGYFRKR